MKVTKEPLYQPFTPYTLKISIDDVRDHDLFLNLLKRARDEVKDGGIYYGMLTKLLHVVESGWGLRS